MDSYNVTTHSLKYFLLHSFLLQALRLTLFAWKLFIFYTLINDFKIFYNLMHKGIYKTGKSTIKYKNIFLLNRSNSDSLVIFFIQNESIQLVYEYCALKLYILNVCLLGWIILE